MQSCACCPLSIGLAYQPSLLARLEDQNTLSFHHHCELCGPSQADNDTD